MIFSLSAGTLVILLALLIFSAFRVLREYERGVVFMLGRFWRVKGPGLVLVIPVVQQMVRVDLRTVVMDVPSQDVISRDNVSVKVNAVVYFRVVDPQNAIIQVANFLEATSQLAQTTLRAVLGKHDLDEMLSEREKLNLDIQKVLDAQTDAWGIKVSNVEIKHVDLNESMVRAIAAGRSGTRAARQGDPRRRRAAGLGETARSGADAVPAAAGDAAALPADADAGGGRSQLDHRVSGADRDDGGVAPAPARRRGAGARGHRSDDGDHRQSRGQQRAAALSRAQ